MNATPTTAPPETTRPRLAKDKLGVLTVAFFAFAAAAPIGALVGATPLIFIGVGPGAPVAVLIAAALIAIFAVGYLLISQKIRNAGGFIVLVSRGLGNMLAGASAGVIVSMYIGLSVGLWALFGLFAEFLFAGLGIQLPALVWAVIGTVIAAILVMSGVGVSIRVLGVLLILEVVVILIFVTALIFNTPASEFATPAIALEGAMTPGIGVALLFTFAMFTMFEAPTVFSEEAKQPERTIPRALYLVVVVIAALYMLSTWAISAHVGNEKIAALAAENPDTFIYVLAATVLGESFAKVLEILVVVSFFAMMIAVQNVFSRYLFSLGRAGVATRAISIVNTKQAPSVASISVAVVIIVLLAAFLLSGVDPFTLYTWMVGLGTTGFIVVLTLASIAVLVFFRRPTHQPNNIWGTLVAPVVALLGTLGVLILVLTNYEYVGGTGPVAWILLGLIPVLAIVGMILARNSRRVDFSDVIEG